MMKKCQDKLKRYDFWVCENGDVNNDNSNKLEPIQLKLMNAQYINIYQPMLFLYFMDEQMS